jgi:hypothetical protein
VDSFIVGEDNTDGSSGSGSQQICWNFGATGSAYSGTTIRILKSNPTGLAGREAIQLKGTHASNKLYIEGSCNVGMGTSFPGDAYTLSQVNVTGAGGKLNLGSGGTLTTIYQSNGAIILNCAVTTINQIGGSLTTFGSGAITTANVSGVFNSESTGTITTLAVKGSGVADFSGSSLARTVTNASITGKGQINAKTGQALAITFTNAISVALDSDSSQVNFGGGVSVQQS